MLLPLEREELAAVMIAFIVLLKDTPNKGYPTTSRSYPSLGLNISFANLFFRDPKRGLNLRR